MHGMEHKKPLPLLNFSARWTWLVKGTSQPLYRQEEPRYPFYRRLAGWLHLVSGRVWINKNFLHIQGFEPHTAQPVSSRYTEFVMVCGLLPVSRRQQTGYVRPQDKILSEKWKT